MINFYWRFLCNAAGVLAPLTNALKGPGKSLSWSPMRDSSFRQTKQLLVSVSVLTHPEPGAPVFLAVDASDSRVGTVLQQKIRGSWSSPKSSPLLIQVLHLDRELLAAYSAVCTSVSY